MPASAQQPSTDAGLNACQQLLAQANNQTIAMAVRADMLAKQLEEAKAELTKIKSSPAPGPEQPRQ